jgi:hypothetical protein
MGGAVYSIVIVVLIAACVGLLVFMRKKDAGPAKPPQKGIIK